jgi:hypothetical protein
VEIIVAARARADRAVDQRRLLRVLGRAIDEEVATVMGCDHHSTRRERDRIRLGYLCTLTSRIQEMNAPESAGAPVHSERRKSRTL